MTHAQAAVSVPARFLLPLLACLLAVAAGCGESGTRSEAEYQALIGEWTVVRVEVDDVSYTVETRDRYDTLSVAFNEASDTRRYVIQGVQDGRTERIADGEVALTGNGRLALLTGLSQRVLLTYELTSSRQAVLVVPSFRTSGSEALMQALLPRQSWAEGQRVVLDLEYQTF